MAQNDSDLQMFKCTLHFHECFSRPRKRTEGEGRGAGAGGGMEGKQVREGEQSGKENCGGDKGEEKQQAWVHKVIQGRGQMGQGK